MNLINVVVGLAILGWLMWNQLQVRPVSGRRMRVAVVLGAVGVVQLVSTVSKHPVPGIGWVGLVLGLAVGVGLAVWRGAGTRLWSEGGVVMRQGSLFTAALWLVGVAIHVVLGVGLSSVSPGAEWATSSSVLLFVGVSLLVQALVVAARARRPLPAVVATPDRGGLDGVADGASGRG